MPVAVPHLLANGTAIEHSDSAYQRNTMAAICSYYFTDLTELIWDGVDKREDCSRSWMFDFDA